jgi:hypothetical protein
MTPAAEYGAWKTSSHCGPSQGCVEVARLSASTIAVRDSRHSEIQSPVLSFDVFEWKRFIAMIKKGNAVSPGHQ